MRIISVKNALIAMRVVSARRAGHSVYTGICDELNITVQADSFIGLHASLADAASGLLLDMLEDGELDVFLREKGWEIDQPVRAGEEVFFSFATVDACLA